MKKQPSFPGHQLTEDGLRARSSEMKPGDTPPPPPVPSCTIVDFFRDALGRSGKVRDELRVPQSGHYVRSL